MSPFYQVNRHYQDGDDPYFLVKSVELLAPGESILENGASQIPINNEGTRLRVLVSEAAGNLERISINAVSVYSLEEFPDPYLTEEVILKGRENLGSAHVVLKGDKHTPDLSIEYYEGKAPFNAGDNWDQAVMSKERK